MKLSLINKGGLAACALLSAVSNTGFAFSSETWEESSSEIFSNWVVSLSLGYPSYSRNGVNQTLNLTPTISKTLVHMNTTQALFDGELFVGVQRPVLAQSVLQLGFAVATSSVATLTGTIWDDTYQQFNNFDYSYKIRHYHGALKGKLLSDLGGNGYWLYGSASVGMGSNKSYDFTSTPLIYPAVNPPPFVENATTSWMYSVGIGVQKELNTNWQFGVGYEFSDWGGSNLGPSPTQSSTDRIGMPHFFTNTLLLNLTYIC